MRPNQTSTARVAALSTISAQHPIAGPSPAHLSRLMDGTQIHSGVGRANVSNAAYLEGDISEGDMIYTGDPFFTGDLANADTALAAADTLVGDMVEEGGFNVPRIIRNLPTSAKVALGIAAGGAAAYGGVKAVKAIQNAHRRHKARKQALRNAEQRAVSAGTINNQQYAAGNLKMIDPRSPLAFYSASGSSLVAYPIVPSARFIAHDLSFGLSYQAGLSPFLTQVVTATQATPADPFVATLTGPVAGRYYQCIIIKIGGNMLQTNPGIIYDIQVTMPLANGDSMVVNSSNPWRFMLMNKFDSTIVLFPWILIAQNPTLMVGQYSSVRPIIVSVSNSLPVGATVNVTVPGTEHVWTRAMRNSLVTGLLKR